MYAALKRMRPLTMSQLFRVKPGDKYYYYSQGVEPIGAVYEATVTEVYEHHFILDLYPVVETMEDWPVFEKYIEHTRVSFSKYDGCERYCRSFLFSELILMDDYDEE